MNTDLPGMVFYPAVSIIIGFLLVGSIGLYYDESTKTRGLFFFVFLVPLVISYTLLQNVLYLDFFFYGLVIGGIVCGYYFFNHHHEIFADYVKIALTIFIALMLFVILYNFALLIFMNGFIGGYSHDRFEFISYILNIVIIAGLYILVVRKIRGLNVSKVFVFGPSRSGKTYFMLGMYKQFVGFFEGHLKEVIFCGDRKEEKFFSSDYYLGQIEKNEPLRSNVTDMVGIYTLMGKKSGLESIELTLVDYAGEWVHDLTSKIDPVYYSDITAKLGKSLGIDQATLSENIGFIKFVKSIKENHQDIIPDIIEDVVLSFIFKRLTSSGKIILLIDGDKVAKDDGPSRDELTRLFGYYAKIMDYCGDEKQYAFVVTKTDKIKPLDTVSENSPQAEEVESDIFNYLRTITTFQAIENKAGSTPVFFFAVSVNPMSSHDQQNVITQIFPWRFGEVARFEF
ncbi:hypothetical protein [uncultured Methanoregula sp.]|uniref:hypothetical protein n=1 Tax=uncultured Methanoregula sp. TaxID=1005933 RepID=UPI0037483EF5